MANHAKANQHLATAAKHAKAGNARLAQRHAFLAARALSSSAADGDPEPATTKNFVRAASLRATDKTNAEAQATDMPVLAVHVHPVMALKGRLPKLRAIHAARSTP